VSDEPVRLTTANAHTASWLVAGPASPVKGAASSPDRTEPTVTTTSTPAVPRGDEDHLYRRQHDNLQRAVARVVNAPRELIEDACQSAWTIMLRRQPDRATIFAWLRVVAIHEAYRLSAAERTAHLEDLGHSQRWDAVIADRVSIDDALEVRRALVCIAELPARQRQDLSLRVAGFSYREIARITGDRTYTNVNKHLRKARARIRLAELP
jgi:DNA-directed RNA polymerase specialized sigma24 family protein